MNHTSLFRRVAPALCVSALSAMLLACGGPSPQKVCELENQVWVAAGKAKGTETIKSCLEGMEKVAKEDPPQFKCLAGCAEHSAEYSGKDADGMMNCHDSCYREFRRK